MYVCYDACMYVCMYLCACVFVLGTVEKYAYSCS